MKYLLLPIVVLLVACTIDVSSPQVRVSLCSEGGCSLYNCEPSDAGPSCSLVINVGAE